MGQVEQSPDPIGASNAILQDPQFVSLFQKAGIDANAIAAKLQQAQDPEQVRQGAAALRAKLQPFIAQPQSEAFTLSPGQKRFIGGREVAAVAPTPEKPPTRFRSLSPQEVAAAGLPVGTAAQMNDTTGEIRVMNTPSNPAKSIQQLRKEFRSLPTVKAYESALPIVESVKNAPDTPAGDLQVVYSVGKALDPDSVVREGELQLTQNATPFLQQIVGKARAEIRGKGRLTPQTRRDLVDMLKQRIQGYQQAYTRDYDQYAQYATETGVDASSVVGTRPESAFTQPAATEDPLGIR